MPNQKRKVLTIIFAIWLIWRVFTLVTGMVALEVIPFTNTFSGYSLQQDAGLPIYWERWLNFDGGAYLYLADRGYFGVGLLQAYFPLYPILIRIGTVSIATITGTSLPTPLLNIRIITGLVISSLCSLLFLIASYKYLRLRFRTTFVYLFLAVIAAFPTSFFYHAYYTESVFMLSTVLAFYFFEKKWWLPCALSIALASAGRIVGIFLVPAFMLELYLSEVYHWNIKEMLKQIVPFIQKNFVKLFYLSLGSLGLLSYMLYLFIVFHDPLFFFHVQSEFGAGRQENLISFPQVVWRYIKIVWTVRPIDLKYYAYIQEFAMTMLGLAVMGYMLKYFKSLKIKVSEIAFCIGAFFLPPLTGNFSSMPRYLLVCFPLFIVIAHLLEKRRKTKWIYFTISILLLIFNIILFIQGRWVA